MTHNETICLLMFTMTISYAVGAFIGWNEGRRYERSKRNRMQ